MTAREKAIALLHRITNTPENVFDPRIVDCVDALIDAARASESAHTRALQATKLPPPPAGAYYDGVNTLRCLVCFTKYPCPEHTRPAVGEVAP